MGTLMPQWGADPQLWHCESSALASGTESGCCIQPRHGHLAVLQLSVMDFRLFIVRMNVSTIWGDVFFWWVVMCCWVGFLPYLGITALRQWCFCRCAESWVLKVFDYGDCWLCPLFLSFPSCRAHSKRHPETERNPGACVLWQSSHCSEVVTWFLIISDLTSLPLRSGVRLILKSLESKFWHKPSSLCRARERGLPQPSPSLKWRLGVSSGYQHL